ncbi:MAG TPA: extracellular solute-binding protein [Kofleriaceae bacterium]|nr:extracellular solute-binding protein [Kofleriaceae bacterium]
MKNANARARARAARASLALAGLASLALAASLAACQGDGKTTVRFWAMGSEAEVVAELIEGFERAHPELRVDVQQVPWMAAHEKLLTAFVGEATPDLAQLGNTWVPEFATLGALAPLDDAVAASATTSSAVPPSDYFAGIWATNEVLGRLHGVPWYVDTRLLFYRRDLLAAATGTADVPETWPAWLAALRAIKAAGGPERYAILLPLDEFEQLLALALSQDEPLLREDGRWGNFRSAGFRSALSFYLRLFADRLAPLVIQTQASNPWHELGRGYVAFMISGPWSIGQMKRRLPAAQQDSWGTAPLPGPTGPGTGAAGGSSLVVFRGAAHPREAWQLVEYLSQPAQQKRFYELTGNLPPRRTTWDDPVLASDAHVRAFRLQLERVKRTPPVPEWERIATEMRVVSERAARRVGPAMTEAELATIALEAATELDARVDAILEKRRWILARREAR